jgi:hypothetical protein
MKLLNKELGMIRILLTFLLLTTNAWAAPEWDKTRPDPTDLLSAYPADVLENNEALDRLLFDYSQFQISYSSDAQVNISSGSVACSSTTERRFRRNAASTNVTFSDLDTGSRTPSTTYHVYAVCDADATGATFKLSTNSSTPTGVTFYRKIGSFFNTSSNTIRNIVTDSLSNMKDWESKSSGVTYQALTDGYFVARVSGGGTPSNNAMVVLYSDAFSPPTTRRSSGNMWFNTGQNAGTVANIEGGAMIPVKAGDFYRGVLTTWASGSTPTAEFFWVAR